MKSRTKAAVSFASRPLAIDLCAGSGAATEKLLSLGFSRVCVDTWGQVKSTAKTRVLTADVRTLNPASFPRPTVVWASPPCTEFSRTLMPWLASTAPTPDLSIVRACVELIEAWKPRVWCIENVRGAAPWLAELLGPPRQIVSARWYLWGNFPELDVRIPRSEHTKEGRSSRATRERSRIPEPLAQAFALACERELRQLELPFSRGAL